LNNLRLSGPFDLFNKQHKRKEEIKFKGGKKPFSQSRDVLDSGELIKKRGKGRRESKGMRGGSVKLESSHTTNIMMERGDRTYSSLRTGSQNPN